MSRPDLAAPTKSPGWWEESAQAQQGGVEPATRDEIAQFVNETCWKQWLPVFRPWHKQVEENIRMVSGRQYDHFVENLGEFIDVSRYFGSPDDRWRAEPVFNWLAHYYKLTLSKLTENLPGVGFLPGGADYDDAVLARVMEPIWKYEWIQMGMPEQLFQFYGWIILASRAITKLRWDPDRGPKQDYRGPATLETFQGNVATRRQISDAPWTKNGDGGFEPAFIRGPDGNPLMDKGQPVFGNPYSSRLGDLALDIVVPTSVLSPHGPVPFHLKPWYTQDILIPMDEFEHKFGVTDLEPDELTADEDLHLRLAFGNAYGMPSSPQGNFDVGHVEGIVLKGYKRVREHWRRDLPNHPILSRGRLTCVTATEGRVLYDDINPFWVEGSHEEVVMPFDAWDAVPFPARNEGMGDIEFLAPLNRAINRRLGGAMDSVDHNEQPVLFYNEDSISEEFADQINVPGARIPATLNPSVGPPAFRLEPADLPRGSIEMAQQLENWMRTLGSLPFSAEGVPQTQDPSGELQREQRFDVDRAWGATIRLHSYGWARLAEKMGGILAACMTDDRLLVLSGEDNAAEFLMVGQQMFTGRINAYPLPESMVLESRQEKQNRVMQLVTMGLPAEMAFQVLNYPDLNRALRPGGPAYSMAQQENLEMLLGQLPMVLPEHDHEVHLLVHKRQMQTVAYRDAGPQLQQLMRMHVFLHEQFMVGDAVHQQALAAQAVAATGGEAPAGGGSPKPALPASTGPSASAGKAPKGADLERGAGTPGGADPRRTQLAISR